MTRIAALLLAVFAAGTAAAQAPSGGSARADPAKLLRTVLIIAETGFDPQAA